MHRGLRFVFAAVVGAGVAAMLAFAAPASARKYQMSGDWVRRNGTVFIPLQFAGTAMGTGGQMTAGQAAELERRAQTEQITVNGLLSAVGAEDDKTADAVIAAGKNHGFKTPDPTSLDNMFPGVAKPGDDVPNPLTTTGVVSFCALSGVLLSSASIAAGNISTAIHAIAEVPSSVSARIG